MAENVIFFKRYPLSVGQQIFIEDGPRMGDWIVISVGEKKIGLRCPVSGTEVNWDRFCYFVEERESAFPVDDST
ncbi:MAG: hypothetical protein DSY58_09200 [Desulfobulbus sp.]|nr:MAG: hypothetical protein DSY58_09200 [Desulfobulbus sp.]RUM39758.1 MAG: hypothetical protein DSY70_05085 [Desulfobulbus sp.]